MKAISLWQPWATLLVIGAKKYVSRSWKLPENLIGQRIAIYAAKHVDGKNKYLCLDNVKPIPGNTEF
jgi:hypothetical protein